MVEETKQERMNRERKENQTEVRAVLAYECGACGFSTTVEVRPNGDGLIGVPAMYCGACSKHMNFRPLSFRVVKMEVKTHKEWEMLDKPCGEILYGVGTETRTEQTGPPQKAKGTKKVEGSVDEDGLD